VDANTAIQLVGILVTAGVAWWTLKSTFAYERKKRHEEDAQKINSFLGALTTEINTLWPIYMKQYGGILETLEKGDLPGQFPVAERYFIVYESNAHLIGHVPDSELRDQIVRTYIVGTGMLDTIRLYNELAAKAEEDRGVYPTGSNEARRATRQFEAARAYAMAMRDQHYLLKEEVGKLQNHLKRFANEKADGEYAASQQSGVVTVYTTYIFLGIFNSESWPLRCAIL
jgi:hypothetical protein